MVVLLFGPTCMTHNEQLAKQNKTLDALGLDFPDGFRDIAPMQAGLRLNDHATSALIRDGHGPA
jgi:hypothetical protein